MYRVTYKTTEGSLITTLKDVDRAEELYRLMDNQGMCSNTSLDDLWSTAQGYGATTINTIPNDRKQLWLEIAEDNSEAKKRILAKLLQIRQQAMY